MQNIKPSAQQSPEPWYRVGMVWLMIGLPFIVVVASLVTVTIAYQNAPQIISRSVTE